jgi:N6-L-threonylcarbamoyladenine synthase
MLVLGIETSCDETAAAVVAGDRRILSNVVLSQLDEHRLYGGVVPEIAARSHLDHIGGLVARALAEAGIGYGDLDGVAATAGPGLIGGVLVGLMTGKGIALARNLPFVAVNHMEAHALTPRLTDGIAFPYLALLVSGGHCMLLAVTGPGGYRRYGSTVDDAVGEAFDKTAKMLGLGYPGGPALEAAARTGDPKRFDLPRPMLGRPDCDFSFSGLKTAVRHTLSRLPAGALDAATASDIAASFQQAVADVLADRTARAIARFRSEFPAGDTLVVAGGVAANHTLRAALAETAGRAGMRFVAPPMGLCSDNAAMVAWAGIERLGQGLTDGLDAPARPRWPLDEAAAEPRG